MCTKMDAILDICCKEKLFKLPNISTARNVPVKSDYKYCTTLLPILESDRVSRDEIVALCCRQTHQVKPKSIYIKKDDVLCSIFRISGPEPELYVHVAQVICRYVPLSIQKSWGGLSKIKSTGV